MFDDPDDSFSTFMPPFTGENPKPHNPPSKLHCAVCTECGHQPEQVISKHYRSSKESWQALAGRDGLEYFCALHPAQYVGAIWTLVS